MRYRDYHIDISEHTGLWQAVHDAFEAEIESDGTLAYLSHPIFDAVDLHECKEMIDDWYEDMEYEQNN